jgi:hypothetical protein
MKKISTYVILLVLLNLGFSLIAPWWIMAVVCFILSYAFSMRSFTALVLSFMTVYAVWLGSVYFFDNQLISNITGSLLEIEPYLAPHVSAYLGGFIASFFGVAGALFRPYKKRIKPA